MFSSEKRYLGLVTLDYGDSKKKKTCYRHAEWICSLHPSLRLDHIISDVIFDSYPTDGQTHGQPAGKHISGGV